jgi:adenosine deaminase
MPLKKNKEYIAIIEFLENFETVKYKIKNYLHYQNRLETDSFLDLIKLNNSNQYDLYLEDSFHFLKNRLNFDFLKIFRYLSDIHFITDNGKIYLCNNSLEAYQLLSSAIDINPLISLYILDYTSELDNNSVYRVLNKNIEFKLYGKLENRVDKYSDLHIHLGGALNFDNRLHNILKNINQTKLDQEHERLFNNIVGCDIQIKDIAFTASILETMFIRLYILGKDRRYNQEYIDIHNDLNNLLKLLEENDNIYKYLYYRKYTTTFNNIRNSYQIDNFYFFGNSFEDNLLKSMFENFLNNDINRADRYLVLFLIEQMKIDVQHKEIIEIYFVLRTIIKKFLVQQHNREGLGYFSLYSGSKIRRAKQNYEKEYIIKSLISKKSISYIEGRISLNKDPKNIMNDMVSYIDFFKKHKKKNDKLKFTFHFKREEDKTLKKIIQLYKNGNKKFDKILYLRPTWYMARKNIKYQAMALNSILTEPKYRKHRIIDKFYAKDKYKDYVNKYISGIDGAGREFLTPPEVFAPAYRYFKNSIETSGLVLKGNYPYVPPEKLKEIDFQYTYHVGEDFRDILSGLRAIYEAILFLDLKDGDRLGHALALGIEPKKFLLVRNKDIKLTKLEVLDNAIFAYYMIEKFNINFIEIKNSLNELIFGLSKEIYKPLKDIPFSIHDLIDAWFLRRNCPNEIKMCKNLFRNKIFTSHIEKKENRTYNLKKLLKDKNLYHFIPNFNYVKYAMPDFFDFNKSSHFPIHNRYKYIQNNPIAYSILWLYHKDPEVIFEGAKYYNDNFLFSEDFYEYLQDIMMEYIIIKRNIIIESMPTSNILIGSFSKYTEHPIFRFKSIGKEITPNRFNIRTKKLKVILGTDNPGIQNTSFIKELQHLKNACNQLGYTEEESYEYIENIISDGNRVFG